ncbi:MAG: ABC transporter ATP-binding protein [Planctomycetota bacterium]|nr:MAG: ABC transporter ATP-binding protein [Planctomycetota bacterium]
MTAAFLRSLFRPYLGVLALVAVASLAFAFADALRAQLVKPLLDDVLAGADVEEQAGDALLAAAAGPQAKASAQAFVPPRTDPSAREALRRDPALGGVAEVGAVADPALRRLLERTGRGLLDAAERIERPPTVLWGVRLERATGRAQAWEALAEAVVLQREAIRRAQGENRTAREAAALLSLRARERGLDAGLRRVVELLAFIAGAALAIGLTMGAAGFSRNYLNRYLQARIFRDLQNRLAAHLISLPVGFFEGSRRRGDTLSRLTNDLAHVANLLLVLLTGATRVLHLVVLFAWAVQLSGLLCLGLGLLGLPLVLSVRRFGKRIRRGARRVQQEAGKAFESMQQMLAGMREVKAFQREAHEARRFEEVADAALAASLQVVRARSAAKVFQQTANDLAAPLLFLFGGYFVVTRQADMSAGDFGAFLGLVVLMYQPAKVVGDSYNQFMQALPSLRRVHELFSLRPAELERPGAQPIAGLREGFALEEVSFAYEEEDGEVLRQVSLRAPRGTLTALVGRTGSGKSTLVDLIARFHVPSGGRILVDGRDLLDVRLSDYLNLVALVPQEGFLFNDSVRENIRYGRLDASDEEVEAAARAACVHEEILALPQGYDTLAGERGNRLSGGQVQRIALARAFLKKPQILLLDEATSALDAHTERLVQRALDELARGATTFVVAHRLSTVERADQIVVLDAGRVVELGRHEELLARGGVYARLVERQLGTGGVATPPAPQTEKTPNGEHGGRNDAAEEVEA